MKEYMNLKETMLKEAKSRGTMINKFLTSETPAVWVTSSKEQHDEVLQEGVDKGDASSQSVVLHLTIEDEEDLFAYVASAMVKIDKGDWGKRVFIDKDILSKIDTELDRLKGLESDFNTSVAEAMSDQDIKEDITNLIDIFNLMVEQHGYNIYFVKGRRTNG